MVLGWLCKTLYLLIIINYVFRRIHLWVKIRFTWSLYSKIFIFYSFGHLRLDCFISHKRKTYKERYFYAFFIVFYIFSVISISFFPFCPSYQLDYFPEMLTLRYNLIPFDSFQNQISWRPDKHIILFIPTWFIFPFLLRWKYSWKKIIFFWLCVSFWVEILQFLYSFISSNLWYYPPKVFNVDDIIMNTIWVFIWFIAYSIYENLSKIYKK